MSLTGRMIEELEDNPNEKYFKAIINNQKQIILILNDIKELNKTIKYE